MTENPNVPVLCATGVSAIVAGDAGDFRVLDGVSLEVDAGEIVDITGSSGCGKTTLLRALARLLPGAVGTLSLRGVSAHDLTPQAWRAAVALLPQKPTMVAGTVRENLLLPWTLKVRAQQSAPEDAVLRAALDGLHLSDVSLERDTDRLSVGQQARIALLRILMTNPSVLMLDEPDANLDDASAAQVTQATSQFASAGGAVIRVRHQRTDALASRRFSMCGGQLTETTS
ncbi:MAG: ABC transporter ATP-binding protein [Actinobacteria bacterium HGW-Actinobacteria-7]|nr:MAG: ABC transporter ATP-binding protein [Actinobacteria bacterium HGW-Actinobacteria-7]